MLFQALVVAAVACQALANPIDDPTRTLSAKRCETSYVYTLIGDGDPHQNYYNEQVSENINCGSSSSCSVAHEEGVEITFGFSAEATVDSWVGLGFNVEESFSESNSYTCYGESGQTTCIWYNMAYTAYTVQKNIAGCGQANKPIGEPFVLKSPNSNNAGGEMYYCAQGTACQTMNYGYWDNSGPAGTA